jgi:hypothetical protein
MRIKNALIQIIKRAHLANKDQVINRAGTRNFDGLYLSNSGKSLMNHLRLYEYTAPIFSLRKPNDSRTKPLKLAVKKTTKQNNIATGNERKEDANVPKQARNTKRNKINKTILIKLLVNESAL